MRKTHRIALSGISSAIATLFLIMSVYVPFLDMSCMVIAGLAMLLPISKNDFVGACLCYVSTCILGLLISGNILKILPFIVFFGLHPIIISLLQHFKINIILRYIIKIAFCNLAIFIAWQFLGLVVNINNFIFPYYLIAVVGTALFLIYDVLIENIKRIIGYYIEKFVFGKGKKK